MMNIKRIRRPWQQQKQFQSMGNKIAHDPYYQTSDWKMRRHHHIVSNPYCAECERQGRVTLCWPPPHRGVVDHITPRRKGGSDSDDNLQTLCVKCDAIKRAKDK